jgi:hypothetical protein
MNAPHTHNKLKHFFLQASPFLGVLVIMLAVSGILLPERTTPTGPDPVERADREVDRIVTAFHQYCDDLDAWPVPGKGETKAPPVYHADVRDYACLFEHPADSKNWRGPYLAPSPKSGEESSFTYAGSSARDFYVDPWGHGYKVHGFPPSPESNIISERVVVICSGPNGVLDTPPAGIVHCRPVGDDSIRIIR